MKKAIIAIGITSGILTYFFKGISSYFIIYELAAIILLTGGAIMHHIDDNFKTSRNPIF